MAPADHASAPVGVFANLRPRRRTEQRPVVPAADPHQLRRMFAAEIEAVDAAIVKVLDRHKLVESHDEMIRYHLGVGFPQQARGKRLRPILCLLLGRVAGAGKESIENLMAAVELMHSASLAHDDVQDKEDTRWGRPTACALFGSDQAINLGDSMLGLGYELLSRLWETGVNPAWNLRIIQGAGETQTRMTEGQHLDLLFQGRQDIELDEYLHMIEGKTASICEFVAQSSAMIGHADDLEQPFKQFGHAFGMLYQVVDDYCDVWATSKDIGKTALSDLERGKASLPFVLLCHAAEPALRVRLIRGELGAEECLRELERHNIRERCQQMATDYRARALEGLECIRDAKPTHTLLSAMVQLCAGRAGV